MDKSCKYFLHKGMETASPPGGPPTTTKVGDVIKYKVDGVYQHHIVTIKYKHILAALIDSEQMLLSIEAQLCTRKECKTFRPRRPFALQLKKAFVVETFCTLYVCTAVLQCSTTFVLNHIVN